MLSFVSLPFLLLSSALAATTSNSSIYSNSSSTSNGTQATVDTVASTWFAGWTAGNFSVSNVTWEKYTHVTFAFAVTTSEIGVLDLAGEDDVLTEFVKTAQSQDVKALVSVGGWTGSQYFSSYVATEANRTAFVKSITGLQTKYGVDGVEFDWEYPDAAGIGCNVMSPNDTANFLLFLQELRADPIGKNLILTAAASANPWNDATGAPSTDLSGFAKVLDWIEIMNYDVWGSWSNTVGPNAPLNDTCAAPANQQGSAVSFVDKWTAAGIPHHQIVLGVAAYGHSYVVDVEDAIDCTDTDYPDGSIAFYAPFDKNSHPVGDAWDNGVGTDQCGNPTVPSGDVDFWALIEEGYLYANGTAAAGIDYRFDQCSQTAYVYNETSQIMVSFDDAPAFAAKGNFIKNSQLRGFAMWQAGGDYNDILLDSIRTAVGFDDDENC